MQKKLILILIIAVTAGITYGSVAHFGLLGFLPAWILNFALMMCIFAFTETLKPKFTSGYYKEQKWEHKGRIYEKFGINIFRKLLVVIGWEKLNKKANPVKNSIEAISHLEYKTKQSELGHLIIFVIVFVFTVYVAIQHGIARTVWLVILNILLNLYPVLLQRYNRPRLQRALALMNYKKARVNKGI